MQLCKSVWCMDQTQGLTLVPMVYPIYLPDITNSIFQAVSLNKKKNNKLQPTKLVFPLADGFQPTVGPTL